MGAAALLLALVGGGYIASRYVSGKAGQKMAQTAAHMAREHMGATAATAARAATVAPAVARQLPYLQYEHGFLPTMTRKEALLILGFAEAASPSDNEIEKRFRRVMALHHDDVGGSPLVARKVIEARQCLKP
jgi:hypothetical protein